MKQSLTGLLVLLTAPLCATGARAAEVFTYVDLVNRLTDLERVAVLPAEGETCAQWSSYDRASRYDAETDTYVAWDANADGNGIIRREGNTSVIAEMQGPGVIWRIWSATAAEGHVKVYLDDQETPAIDMPFIDYFNHENEPFTRPSLVHRTAMGYNSYVPIPYSESCRITADDGWGAYYHFVYTTFPPGTELPTFGMELSEDELAALDRAEAVLGAQGPPPLGPYPEQKTVTVDAVATPGKEIEFAALDGARAITRLRVSLDTPGTPADYEFLRNLTLAIYWDGERTPAVWCPLGDFFGTAPGVNDYTSLPLGMTRDGFYSNWFMPFADGARVCLTNENAEACRIRLELTHAPLQRPVAEYGRFHAKWHRDAFLQPERRPIDWTLLKTQGRGRFCGVMLHVWNPRGGWWGEGDEKFFVDGERFPSTFGTGSEDYFGYAWCSPELFQNAYHNQTISMNNRGHISVNRWHITDNIPFQRLFEGAIEKYFPNARGTLYASTVYWYLAPGGLDPYDARPQDERIGYWTPIEIYRVPGALEGEKLEVLSRSAGELAHQDMVGFGENWSNDTHLWWTGAAPGARLELGIPVAEDGVYRLTAQMTKAPDYGIVQVTLDGKSLGAPIDLYATGVVATGTLDWGEHPLTAGQHSLGLEITGANPQAVKAHMVGLDYVRLETVDQD
jgi:hypothetical protein